MELLKINVFKYIEKNLFTKPLLSPKFYILNIEGLYHTYQNKDKDFRSEEEIEDSIYLKEFLKTASRFEILSLQGKIGLKLNYELNNDYICLILQLLYNKNLKFFSIDNLFSYPDYIAYTYDEDGCILHERTNEEIKEYCDNLLINFDNVFTIKYCLEFINEDDILCINTLDFKNFIDIAKY